MTVAAGIDVGGTNIMVAAVDERHRVLARRKTRTPEGPDAIVDAVAEALSDLDTPVAAGFAAPGPVVDGVLQHAPNLPGFTEPVPLATLLAERLGLPVVGENDVTAGAVGEWVAGAGRGSDDLLGVWLGTGVGGGLVLGGRPWRGVSGAAGEFGHMCVRQGGAQCGCGRRGCVEAYAGRAAMEQTARTAADSGQATRLFALQQEKGKATLTSGVWAAALKEGDALATRLMDEAVDALGAAIGAALNLLDINRVIIGGGVAEKLGQPLVDRIADATGPYLMVRDAPRRFVLAELEDDSGVVGAAALARKAAAA